MGLMSSTTQVPSSPAALARPERGVPLGRRRQTGLDVSFRGLGMPIRMLDVDENLVADRPGLLIIADKGFASKEFENDLVMRGAELLRPSFKREKKRKGKGPHKSVRQLIGKG